MISNLLPCGLKNMKLQSSTDGAGKDENDNHLVLTPNAKGLSYALSKTWPPNMVEPQKRKHATIFFIFLMAVYTAYAIGSIATMILKRYTPPTSFSRDTDVTYFTPPYFTFCSSEGYLQVGCIYDSEALNSRACLMTLTYFETFAMDMDAWCTSVKVSDRISATPPSIMLQIEGKDKEYIFYFMTSEQLTESTSIDEMEESHDFGWYMLGAVYEVEITKQIVKKLKPIAGGLGTKFSETVSYNLIGVYTSEVSTTSNISSEIITTLHPNMLWFYVWANSLGMDVLEETDPVDVLNMIGSIAGVLSYIFLFFSVIYGKSIYSNMKRLEDEHVELAVREAQSKALIS